MEEIDQGKRDKYLANHYHLLRFAPSRYDYPWFCRYVVKETWWDEYVNYIVEQHGSGTVLTSEVVKWFMDPEEFVTSVYRFLNENYPVETEEKENKDKITYGKAPVECPVDPEARKRCPECAERVW